MRRGVTLAECMIASAVLGLLVLVLLSGVTVATRIADDNAQLLAAEAVAWDAAWKRFNEDYKDAAGNTPLKGVKRKVGYIMIHSRIDL